MTREETIKNIKEQMDLYVWQLEDINKVVEPRRYEQYRLAIMSFEMAIKALEQQPCEDCINREKAKQFLYERLNRLNNDELYDIFSRIIDDMYNELPSVTPRLFINKPCVSEGVCREDKIQVLGKIKEEIKDNTYFINETTEKEGIDFETVEKIIDKYKAESEEV